MIDVASYHELADAGLLSVKLPNGTQVCLICYDGEVTAFLDECPHSGMPLSSGELLEKCQLECAWHGAIFDCVTGRVLRGPAEEPLTKYVVKVENGRVLVIDPGS